MTKKIKTALVVPVLLYLVLALACSSESSRDPSHSSELLVAAAANLQDAFNDLGKRFTQRTGIRVIFNFASTAELEKQIENGAPFDVFAAADLAHVEILERAGLITPGTKSLYARGRLVLWTSPESKIKIDRVEEITRSDIGRVAIAKPDVAPYGQASVESLKALNIWPAVEPKVIYGQSVSQTKQYVATGNAEVCFIPLALVKPGEGKYLEIDERLHRPIDQALAVVKATRKEQDARKFIEYVMGEEGQALLQRYGYNKPGPR